MVSISFHRERSWSTPPKDATHSLAHTYQSFQTSTVLEVYQSGSRAVISLYSSFLRLRPQLIFFLRQPSRRKTRLLHLILIPHNSHKLDWIQTDPFAIPRRQILNIHLVQQIRQPKANVIFLGFMFCSSLDLCLTRSWNSCCLVTTLLAGE
jgi:hypothetical protein